MRACLALIVAAVVASCTHDYENFRFPKTLAPASLDAGDAGDAGALDGD